MAQIYQLHGSGNKKKSIGKKGASRKPRRRECSEVEVCEHRSRNSYSYFGFDPSLV